MPGPLAAGPVAAGWLITLAAVVAAAAWAERSSHAEPLPRRSALAVTGWAALGALEGLVRVARAEGLAGRHDAWLVALGWPLSLAVAVLAVVAVTGAVRRVVLTGRLLPVAVDSAVIGVGVVAVAWGLTGSAAPPDAVLWPARPVLSAVVGATLVTLVLRARALSPSLVVDGRYRSALGWAAAAAAAMAVSGWVMVATGPAAPTPARWVAAVATAVGHGCAATAALAGPSRAAPARRAALPERLVPSVVAGTAVVALVVRGVWSDGVEPVGAVLGGALLLCVLVSQVLSSREKHQLAAELEFSQARLAAMAVNSGDVIMGLDETGRVLAVNDAARELLARDPEVLVGSDVVVLAETEDRLRLRAAVLDVVHGERESARVELTLCAPAVGSVELRLRGVPGGAVANLSDVTEAVRLRERLVAMTRFDGMTGLANRTHLLGELGEWLDEGDQVAVLFVDLDGFKAVNDRFGHAAGDAVLVEVAQRLLRAAADRPRPTLVARVGGDEFVLALRDTRLAGALEAGEAVLTAMRPTFAIRDRAVRLGASVGVAATDDGSRTLVAADPPTAAPETSGAPGLLHRADIAMFAAKQEGRFQVRRWDRRLEDAARRRVDIAIGLRRALDTGRLALAYQPIVRLSDGVIVGVEALIRLPRADGDGSEPGSLAGLADLVSPSELVEVAEGTGEIDELGRWVLTEATHQASLWQRMGHPVRVSVNMSVRQLSAPGFDTAVLEALAAARLPAERLVIEITEGQLLGEGDEADHTVTRLRGHGIGLAIDDFGSGYSSLSYLRRMPVRIVKIDRTLLAGVGTDDRATTVVRAVIGVARGLGLQVVCEGIESLGTARLLRDLGAHAGQGFALYAAMAPSALRDVLDGSGVDLAADLRRARGDTPPSISHVETSRVPD